MVLLLPRNLWTTVQAVNSGHQHLPVLQDRQGLPGDLVTHLRLARSLTLRTLPPPSPTHSYTHFLLTLRILKWAPIMLPSPLHNVNSLMSNCSLHEVRLKVVCTGLLIYCPPFQHLSPHRSPCAIQLESSLFLTPMQPSPLQICSHSSSHLTSFRFCPFTRARCKCSFPLEAILL